MIDLASTPLRGAGILTQQVSDTAVLLNPADGKYFSLNEVGGRVWDMCDGIHTVAEIISIVTIEFEAPSEIIKADVIELLEDLIHERLVVESA